MNLLQYIKNLIENKDIKISSHYVGNNRVNNSGDALEHFIKDGFLDSLITYDLLWF